MTPVRWANPWAVLGLALFVLVADQWTKVAAIEHLANPAHPMVVIGDGELSVGQLFAARGVSADELATAVSQRHIWLQDKARDLRADMPVANAIVPRQLLVLDGTGFPAPRRLRAQAGDESRDLADLIAEQFRVDRSGAQKLLDAGVWRATRPVDDVAAIPRTGHPVALLIREIRVVDGFMTLVYAENPGAAWGFMRSASPTVRQVFFSVISLLASVAMIWAIWSGWMGSALSTWALGLVLGGAIGNLIDRGMYQVVVDFILNFVGEHRWPVYNVADIGISVGVGLILLELFLQRGDDAEPSQHAG
jgi:signal peptidase II